MDRQWDREDEKVREYYKFVCLGLVVGNVLGFSSMPCFYCARQQGQTTSEKAEWPLLSLGCDKAR